MTNRFPIDPSKVKLYRVLPDGTQQEIPIGQTATFNPPYNPDTDRLMGVVDDTAVIGYMIQDIPPISIAWEFKDSVEQWQFMSTLLGRWWRIKAYLHEKMARWAN